MIAAKITNMIVLAVKNTLTNFSLRYAASQVSWLGKPGDMVVLFPYGTRSQSPLSCQVIKFNLSGDESNRVGLEFDSESLPSDAMEEGEYECGNFITGSTIRFTPNGIKIYSHDALNVEVVGNINIQCGGNVSVESVGSATIKASTVDVEAETVTVTATSAIIDADCSIGGSGGLGLARVGDAVAVDTGTGIGTITSGSGNHTAT
jgi:hypothetical protein